VAVICIDCRAGLEAKNKTKTVSDEVSRKSRLVLVILAFFLGESGIYQYCAGKIGSGGTMLILTITGYSTVVLLFGFILLAVVWIWNLIDFIVALVSYFRDKESKLIQYFPNYLSGYASARW
jgi:TM2 domain-containing membrane protein YozV